MPSSQTFGDDAVERWRDRVQTQSANTRSRNGDGRSARESEPPRTIAQAATELGLSVHTVRAWVASRRLAHIRFGRAIRIPAAEIRRMIDKNTVPAIEER